VTVAGDDKLAFHVAEPQGTAASAS